MVIHILIRLPQKHVSVLKAEVLSDNHLKINPSLSALKTSALYPSSRELVISVW